jgi:hypothetical protein
MKKMAFSIEQFAMGKLLLKKCHSSQWLLMSIGGILTAIEKKLGA